MLFSLAFTLCAATLPLLDEGDLLALHDAPMPQTGLPAGWTVRAVKGHSAPSFRIIDTVGERILRIEGRGTAAWAMRPLPQRMVEGDGMLAWRWRVLARPDSADLRHARTDDAPLRIVVLFGKLPGPFGGSGRVLFYTWGTREPEGFAARSFPSSKLHVIRMAGDDQLGDDWHDVAVQPFADFRRIWKGKPPPITAIGLMQDTDMTGQTAIADLHSLRWTDADSSATALTLEDLP